MNRQALTPDQLSDVLRRAQEIDDGSAEHADLEAYVQAAEEAGISREATTQAIRERLGYTLSAAKLGDFVFARSSDGHFYAAKVDQVEGGSARVRFMNGAASSLPIADLREFAMVPGLKLNYLSPSGGYWANGTVASYNPDAQTITVQSWGVSETISLDKVRILAQTVGSVAKTTANLWAAKIWWLLGGVGLGVILDRLLFR